MQRVSPASNREDASGRLVAWSRVRHTTAGFTVAELLVAMVILTVGILGQAGVMANITLRQHRSTVRMEMTQAAESKLEELRSYGMLGSADSAEVTLGGSLVTSEANHSDVIAAASGRGYVRRWEVAAGPSETRAVALSVVPVNTRMSRASAGTLTFRTIVLVVR